MQIREATPADADAIHAVSVASCRAAYEPILDDDTFLQAVDDPSRVDPLRDHIASGGQFVYRVADAEPSGETDRSGTTVVGFVHAPYGAAGPDHLDENTAYLRSLYVHPDHWNEGVGTALLEDALTHLPDTTTEIRLDVLAANERGRRFYETRGFERRHPGTFEIGGVTYDTVVYARDL